MPDGPVSSFTKFSTPSLSDSVYGIQDPEGAPISRELVIDRLLGLTPIIPGGRLTLETGVPISSTNQTAKGTLYYTPYEHNNVKVWETFSQISLALLMISGRNYDVFLENNATTLSLISWISATDRGANPLVFDTNLGLWTSLDPTQLYLGTIRSSGTNVTEDSFTKRFVFNNYNRHFRPFKTGETVNVHTYATTTFREWNGGTGGVRIGYVAGLPTAVNVEIGSELKDGALMNVGMDSTTTPSLSMSVGNADTLFSRSSAGTPILSEVGFHELVPLEYGGATPASFNLYSISGGLFS